MKDFLIRLICFIFLPFLLLSLFCFYIWEWRVSRVIDNIIVLIEYYVPLFYCRLFYPTCGWYNYYFDEKSYRPRYLTLTCGKTRWFWREPKLKNWKFSDVSYY